MAKRRKKPGMRGLFAKRLTPEEEVEQREAAFAAIRRLYGAVVPVWQSCQRGYCRRHQQCSRDIRPCLERGWPLLPTALQNKAWWQVVAGGPRRVPPATNTERILRRYPPTNFV